MIWKCIIFASRSASASDNSENAGSNVLSGKFSTPPVVLARPRNDVRDEGRNGVVGREALERDVDRCRIVAGVSVAIPTGPFVAFCGSKLDGEALCCTRSLRA